MKDDFSEETDNIIGQPFKKRLAAHIGPMMLFSILMFIGAWFAWGFAVGFVVLNAGLLYTANSMATLQEAEAVRQEEYFTSDSYNY